MIVVSLQTPSRFDAPCKRLLTYSGFQNDRSLASFFTHGWVWKARVSSFISDRALVSSLADPLSRTSGSPTPRLIVNYLIPSQLSHIPSSSSWSHQSRRSVRRQSNRGWVFGFSGPSLRPPGQLPSMDGPRCPSPPSVGEFRSRYLLIRRLTNSMCR